MDLLQGCVVNKACHVLLHQLLMHISWYLDITMGQSLRIQPGKFAPLTFAWADLQDGINNRAMLEKTLVRHVLGGVAATKARYGSLCSRAYRYTSRM